MSDWSIAFVWCVVQVTVLASIALAGMYWFERRDARVGTRVCNGMILLMLATTCCVIAPLTPSSLPSPAFTSSENTSETGDSEDHKSSAAIQDASFWVDFDWIRARISSGTNSSARPIAELSGYFWLLATVILLSLLIGIVRLFLAASFVWCLRKNAKAIKDDSLQDHARRLAVRMNINATVKLLESPKLRCAAAFGWGETAIVLPESWAHWSDEERSAVIAHELAHLSRQDCWWRAFAALLQTIHAYHPLVYLLSRHLALLQELAADRLAAEAIGSSRVYLRVLTQLALRQDDHSSIRATGSLLPVFSGELIRRIKMLNHQQNSRKSASSHLGGAMAALLLLMSGSGVVGLRAFAQSPQNEPVARVARVSKIKIDTGSNEPVTQRLMRNNQHGMFVIQLDQLMQQPTLATMINAVVAEMASLGPNANADWIQALGGLENIEFIAARPVLSVHNRKDPDTQKTTGSIAFGGRLFVLQLKTNRNLDQWISECVPDAERQSHLGAEYYQLPVIPALGPMPVCVAQLPGDESSIVFGMSELRLVESEPKFAGAPTELCEFLAGKSDSIDADANRWNQDWTELSGGTISLICSDKEIAGTQDWNHERLDCFKHARTFGVRFDFPLDSDRFRVKILLGCDDESSALKAMSALQTRYAEMSQELEEQCREENFAGEPSERVEFAALVTAAKQIISLKPRLVHLEDERVNVVLNVDINASNQLAAYAWLFFLGIM
ncbi:M56 family metallopeptidase [Aureliella helgolandensis]|uniref:Regulatory protein BlaR1 n=1 Tax=Aureliella helgolandensis TaxID=2527968 RepID=A0A518G4V3_9BACT|nr:M56 family metallopeptidase [Aureliella helgolandensis]QDV23624.1 Regulatory protein BlaR1 [Aureliella helgolandensis]